MTNCVVPNIPLTERRAYTMGEAAALVRLSISTLYAERARGRLETIKLAGRRLITREQLDAYIAAAGLAQPAELTAAERGRCVARKESQRVANDPSSTRDRS
jgi:excisionase family DNA binding protein